jgi:hypothetical protein
LETERYVVSVRNADGTEDVVGMFMSRSWALNRAYHHLSDHPQAQMALYDARLDRRCYFTLPRP